MCACTFGRCVPAPKPGFAHPAPMTLPPLSDSNSAISAWLALGTPKCRSPSADSKLAWRPCSGMEAKRDCLAGFRMSAFPYRSGRSGSGRGMSQFDPISGHCSCSPMYLWPVLRQRDQPHVTCFAVTYSQTAGMGRHDDLVIAAALVCWWEESPTCGALPKLQPSEKKITARRGGWEQDKPRRV